MSGNRARFLEAADRIGSRLCRDALWAGRRCNWLGGSKDLSTWAPVYRALGPSPGNRLAGASLYEGTAGIAIFLAHLFSFSRDTIHKCTLEGALKHVLGQLGSRDELPDIGFYTGLTGIAYTLIEAGQILQHDRLVERGINELLRLRQVKPDPQTVPVISGSAGVIPVLIDVASRFGRGELIETALLHGENLLAGADKSAHGWSWETRARWLRNLTGHSHGTAGIAWSLLELHAATGDERFRNAAREALRYERHHFNAERRNWPDFRKLDESGTWHEPRCATAWCHGAPGIGISRLRVRELLPDDGYVAAEIEAAIATTHASLREPNNFSLCHGHAGNAELMVLASERLSRPELRQAAETVGNLGVDRFSDTGVPWPCGVDSAWECPTLMLGMAGIGYFYLRLYDPQRVVPILITIPDRLSVQLE
jgi:lantibiotic modifying enzyme